MLFTSPVYSGDSEVYVAPSELSIQHEIMSFYPKYDAFEPDVDLSEEENMGLFSLAINQFFLNNFVYAGMSLYGATSGKRSGFVLPAIQFGAKAPSFYNLSVRTEFTFGAGGGGRTRRGTGLMLRPAGQLVYDKFTIMPGVGYSLVRFPTSEINSQQIFFSLTRKQNLYYVKCCSARNSGVKKTDLIKNLPKRRGIRFSPAAKLYFSKGKRRKNKIVHSKYSGGVGMDLDFFTDNNSFLGFSSYAPVVGGMAGYMEFLFGPGYSLKLNDAMRVEGSLLFGHAGGGFTDTGGGATIEPRLGVDLRVLSNTSLKLGYGYLYPFKGDFRVATATVGIANHLVGYGVNTPVERTKTLTIKDEDDAVWRRLRMTLSSQRVFNYIPNDNIDFMSFSFDYMLHDYLFANAETMWSYWGKYRGNSYASAILGMGVGTPLFWGLSWDMRAGLGTASGGSLPKDDELLAKASMNLSVQVSDYVSITGGGGYIKTVRKEFFSARYAEVGVKFLFGIPYWKERI